MSFSDTAAAERQSLLRRIPSVDVILGRAGVQELACRVGHRTVRDATRRVLQELRARISSGEVTDVSPQALEAEIAALAERSSPYSLAPLINATGVILHTNLGRAPLARKAIEHLGEVARHYSNLEYNLEAGKRGKRDAHTDALFRELVGAESTLIVNNNAAAVFLSLNALAENSEVVVSRGELIEIGGSFRIPDICAKSGALLREVGTTNRTRASDYAAAVNDRTRVLLRVHPSNFRVVGFTERPSLEEMVELARHHNLILMEDLGSGCLVDLAALGIQDEPPVAPSLRAGVDVVTFSGDKLLGGPQAGIITGKREPLARIRKNPLFRALRVDKLTIGALQATVALYLREDYNAIPTLRMIRMSLAEVTRRALALADRLSKRPGLNVSLEDGEAVIGGGSTPGQSLPTKLITLTHAVGATEIEALLRKNKPPIIARVEGDRVLLDLRTVFEEQEDEIVTAFERLP